MKHFPDETELYLQRKRTAVDFGLFAVQQQKARLTDPETSHRAAKQVAPKAGTAKAKLLAAHRSNPDGLTDREAAELAGLDLRSEYATRCSELVRMGWLTDTAISRPDPDTRTDRMVRRITDLGMEVARGR
jgi:hypothetical protein